jgi:hypothetical protein
MQEPSVDNRPSPKNSLLIPESTEIHYRLHPASLILPRHRVGISQSYCKIGEYCLTIDMRLEYLNVDIVSVCIRKAPRKHGPPRERRCLRSWYSIQGGINHVFSEELPHEAG